MKIPELKISITKVELLLGRLNSTFELAEESGNLKIDGERLPNLKHRWKKKVKKKSSSHYMHKSHLKMDHESKCKQNYKTHGSIVTFVYAVFLDMTPKLQMKK